ncbi:amino acid adenylation domain-containing protein [Bacillus sp. RC252]|uniref:amino acid adenylation domain-containing protein n=1 Tax=Bacillus sp. RC252 TaxID=3156289 RepID=UPI00383618DC
MDLGKIGELIAQYKDDRLDKSDIKKILLQLQNQRKELQLSEAQKGLWAIQGSNKQSAAYNIPLCFRVDHLDLSCFTKACHFMMKQYPILNAVFTMEEGSVSYQIDPTNKTLSLTIEDISVNLEEELINHIHQSVQVPFDLEKGPLFRVTIFGTSDSERVILITIHHIIFDGGSVPIFLQKLYETYNAYREGDEPTIETVDATYDDYVKREKSLIEEKGDASLDYWQEKLKQSLPRLNLPLDKPRSTMNEANTWSQRLDMTQVERLHQFTSKHKAYVWNVIFAVYNLLLHRYSGQNDIVVGMPVNQRSEKRFEKLIGLCINMMPVRSQINIETSFQSYLNTLQKDVMDGMACIYPFPLLVRKLNLGYDTRMSPVFQTAFTFQDVLDPLSESECGFVLMDEVHQQGEYDITLEVVNKPDGMMLNWKYNKSMFEQSTIMRMGEHFINILDCILNDPMKKLFDISLLSQNEVDLLVNDWNNTKMDYPQAECIHQIFERKVLSKPKNIAVIDGSNSITYEELNQKANALASNLKLHGVEPGSLVAVCVERSLDMIVALLGILKAGGAYVPIDPNIPVERAGYILKDSRVSLVIVHSKTSNHLFNVLMQGGGVLENVRLIDLDKKTDEMYCTLPEAEVSSIHQGLDSLAYVLYTSGTTGTPKGVCVTHQSILNTLYFLEQEFPVGKEDRYLLKTNYMFDVSITELFGWFVGEGSVAVAPQGAEQSPKKLVDCVKRYDITHINFVPSMLSLFYEAAKEIDEHRDYQSLKYMMVAGETFPKELADKCVSLFNRARVENIYGPTETSIYAAYFSCGKNGKSNNEDTSIPIGRPIPNTKLYILDRETNRLAPIGVSGELCIAGIGLAKGYLNNDELTNKVFVENPVVPGEKIYRTGDLACWRSDGTIEYLGRLDFQVKVRGFRIELEEIEYHLACHHQIKECAVIVKGSGDAVQLIAYYVTVDDSKKINNVDPQNLKKYLANKLPAYMVPDFIVQLEHLPFTPNGKLDRKHLMNRKITLHKNTQSASRGDEIQKRVLDIWKELLNIEDLEVTDAFFEAGGNSLLAVIMAEKVSKEFNVIFDSTDLFKYPNVEAISNYLNEESGEAFSFGKNKEFHHAQEEPSKQHYPDYYQDSVAIIGISCQFPGAQNYQEFWNNLMEGKNMTTFLDKESLQQTNIPSDVLENPNFVPVSLDLENKDYFDGEFFKLSPNHVTHMDPQFRQLLIHSWRAVEDASYYHKDIANTGVYVSVANHQYGALSQAQFRTEDVTEDPEQYLSWVLSQNGSISSMISYQLGFTGPSLSVHSNCSSSMSALDLAFHSLMSGQIDYAIVAAGAISHIDHKGYIYQPGLNFSSDGRIKTFDKDADGMIAGEGVGAILLKRASDAIESNDHIYGLLRGIATNSDGGDTPGFYSPSVNGQMRVIQKVIEQTKIQPETISYVEAHGTGTKLGDPVEFKALSEVYRRDTTKTSFCGIGSVKPNIGHLDTVAGLAGCIKTVLALHNKQLTPTINYATQNPKINVEQSPFYIVKDQMEWSANDHPRRAAVSSIGLGGTNAHAIFEEYVESPADKDGDVNLPNDLVILPMSAHKESTLIKYVQAMFEHIQTITIDMDDFKSYQFLRNIAYTFQIGRAPMKHRVAFIVHNIGEMQEAMQHFFDGTKSSFFVTGVRDSKGNHAFLEEKVTDFTLEDHTVELAKAWTAGANIDWKQYVQSHPYRRLSLPTYPFDLKSYPWPKRLNSTEQASRGEKTDELVDARLSEYRIHPLVHRNVSTFEKIRYRSFFTGREYFLKDHVVAGQIIMPAVAMLEMARVSISNVTEDEDNLERNVQLRNISWVRPMIIPEQGKVIDIELVRTNLIGGKGDKIIFKIVDRENHEQIQYAEGEAILSSPRRESVVDLKTLLNHTTDPRIEKETCYDYMKLAGVEYGDTFKVVDVVYRGEEGGSQYAIGHLKLSDSLSEVFNQYHLHPSILDGAIQSSIGLLSDSELANLKNDPSGKKTGAITIPFSLQSVEIYKSCKEKMYSIVRDADPTKTSAFAKLLDIDLIDESGVVCVRMRGMGYRSLSIHKDKQNISQDSKLNTIIPVWNPIKNTTVSNNGVESRISNTVVFDMTGNRFEEIKQWNRHYGRILINPNDTIDDLYLKIKEQNVLHILWLAPNETNLQHGNASLKEQQHSGMIYLFRLIKACLRAGYGVKNLRWTVVTFSTQKINDHDKINPVYAGVHGLIGSMAKEYSHWDIRLVDVPRDMPLPLDKIIALPFSAQGKTYALRNDQWFTQGLLAVQTQPSTETVYRLRGVYVVIGGAGGVGELWTRYMIEHYQASVVWIGRRPINKRIQEQLQDMKDFAAKHGVDVPFYISADARDKEQLTRAYEKIRERYSHIHGVIHSAIVLADQSLGNMDEERFVSATSSKVDTSIHMVEVFSKEKLDFILFFSSIETFVREAGQANYAAGCTFIDSYAHALDTDASWFSCNDEGADYKKPLVKTMNWGYWGTVGVVSDAFYRERMATLGFDSLEAEESMVHLERLMSGPFQQVALVKTLNDAGLRQLNISGNAHQLVINIPNAIENQSVLRNVVGESKQIDILTDSLPPKSMHDITLNILCVILKNLSNSSSTGDAWIDLSRLYQIFPPPFHRWIEESKRQLLLGGYVKLEGTDRLIPNEKNDIPINELWSQWDREKHQWLKNMYLKSHVQLVENCLKELENVLLGKKKATDILFPNSSMKVLDGIYKGNPVVDYFNLQLSSILYNVLKSRLEDDPSTKIRILEVGSGTGGTTAFVLDVLKPFQHSIDEYCFTDISKAFLIQAENTFLEGNPFLKTKLLNIEDKPTEQGFDAGYYDIVISTNALHATSDIHKTLRNVKSVMKCNGIVLLNEMCSNNILAHVTFGLLDGWWLYRDEEWRIPGSPGLTGESWIHILSELGFTHATLPDSNAKRLGQQVIVAASDGILIDSDLKNSIVIPSNKDVTSDSNDVMITSVVHSSLAGVSLNSNEDQFIERTQNYLKSLISEALNVPESELDVDRDLEEYGLDSILVVKINNVLAKSFDGLDSSLLFEYNCISKLENYFISERFIELQALLDNHCSSNENGAIELEVRERCVNYLKQIISKALKVECSDIDDDCSLFEYGLDSILVVKINNDLAKDFSDFSNSLVFDYPTITEMVDYLVSSRRNELIDVLGLASKSTDTDSLHFGDSSINQNNLLSAESPIVRDVKDPSMKRDIAIVGLDIRMPDADNVDQFWENIANGIDSIRPLPDDRWWYDDTLLENEHGGFLEDVACFDAPFFGISEKDAAMMDPQERVFIKSVYRAIQDSGYTPENLAETRKIGVFVGVMNATYNGRAAYSSIANRTSYLFDFQGSSMAIDTACSSSLTAIHLAMESLRNGGNECAIAGGVNLLLNTDHFKLLSDLQMISKGKQCKPFSEYADGILVSEGVGAVVLRPLDKAIENGDHIYGIIQGSAVNAAGRTHKYNTPNINAEVDVIVEALKNAGIESNEVSYVEAHGTGTALGDSIEVSALKRAFQNASDEIGRCAIGSVKSNIGHSESASGMASLAKVLMQMKYRKLAPTIHCEKLNSGIIFSSSPFYVQRQLEDWIPSIQKDGKKALVAGISSFGAGGSNAHLIIKEYQPERESLRIDHVRRVSQPVLIPLSARSRDRLEVLMKNLASHLTSCDASLEDIAYTLQVGREHMETRILFIVSTVEELIKKLHSALNTALHDSVTIDQVDQLEREYARDKSAQKLIMNAMDSDKYEMISSHWLRGYPVPWEIGYWSERPNRISLPTYPFNKLFYWEPESPKKQVMGQGEIPLETKPPSSKNQVIHEEQLKQIQPPEYYSYEVQSNTYAFMQKFLVHAIEEEIISKVPTGDYETNFIDLGLPSKAMIRITQQIRKHIDPLFDSALMFEYPTINELATYLSEIYSDQLEELAVTTEEDQSIVLDRSTRETMEENIMCPLSSSQKGIWALQKGLQKSSSYNVPLCFKVNQLSREALEEAYRYTLAKNPALTSAVREMNGELVMVENFYGEPTIPEDDLTHLSHADALDYVKKQSKEPFSLEGTICRLNVYHISDNESLVLFNVHHIVFDGQSSIVFMKTLFSAYEAAIFGKSLPKSDSHARYRNFVMKEQQLVANEEGKNRLHYWKEQLHDAPAPVQLYTDQPRKDIVFDSTGATLSYRLSDQDSFGVAQVARHLNVYTSTVFMAMFNMLLKVYSKQKDIVIGMPLNCREEEDEQNVIGNYVNMIPIRSRLEKRDTLESLCKNLQRTIISAVSRSYPFPLLVRELGIPYDVGYTPLFQIVFMYQDWMDTDSLNTHAFQYVDGIHQEGEYELVLEVIEPANENKNYILNWKYDADLYDEETISRINKHYLQLINQFLRDPAQRIDDVSVMSEVELEIVLNQWNDTSSEYPREMCVHELFREKAQEVPMETALVYDDFHLTYEELDTRSDKLASYLKHCGVGRNQMVAIFMDRSVELVISMLGILKSGAAYVPIDPGFPNERVAHILSDSDVRIVLTRSSLSTNIQSIMDNLDNDSNEHRVLSIDQYDAEELKKSKEIMRGEESTGSDHLAYVIYTSGSTGKPKGVKVHHQALTNFLCSMAKCPGLGANDIMLAVTTHSFDIAALELFLPLIQGATCFICDSVTAKNGEALKGFIEKVSPTIMQATPSTWSMLFHCGWRNREKLKMLCGGEAMSASLRKQICDSGSEAWNLYGPTETTVWSTVSRITADGPITIGKPIDNTQIYILNDQGKPNPILVLGELCIAGDGVSKGYLNRHELNEEKFVDNPFGSSSKLYKTGDLARWKPNGSIEYFGRIDSQVKIRGYRIELGEIETQLMHHPAIAQCAVIDKVLGEENQLVAYFICKPTTSADIIIEEEDLRTYLAKILPGYMIPAYFIELDKLPQTPNFKLDRNLLKQRSISLEQPMGHHQSDGDAVNTVLDIWSGVLGIRNIRSNQGFYEVGGSSVSAAIAANKISETFQVPFTVTDMFKYPKAKDIAAYLGREENQVENEKITRRIPADQMTSREMNQRHKLPDYYQSSVAIVGISCQFPGAENSQQFWDNLVNGVESVQFYSQEELKKMGVSPNILKDKRFVPAQSTIGGKYDFDTDFFKVSAKDAELFDPQLRLLLSNSWKAIEDAGYVPSDISDAGIYMSTSNSHYHSALMKNMDKQDSEALVNFLLSQMGTIPTMISYKLGLKGPSMFVHTNCSSSLAGMSVAFNAIRSKQCTQALVGAATVHAKPGVGYLHEEGLSLSSDGHCKTFDASADGMIGGEGVAVLLLKDAVKAIEDNDNIYAIIRGIGINNDGNDKTGFYAPSVSGQSNVIKQVYNATDVHPDTISYVEAHGTGTKLGDPVEIAALSDAYREYTNQNQYCAIGSVKSNIGHLDAAAGLAGCIKTALVLRNGYVPPSIHYKQPNPNIDFETSPFYVADHGFKLEQGDFPLRAALSSFGIGGTNVHAILEAPNMDMDNRQKRISDEGQFIIPLSAKKQENLNQYVSDLLNYLQSSQEEINLNSMAYTLQAGRVPMFWRVVFVVRNIQELIESLKLFIDRKPDHCSFSGCIDNLSTLISDEEEQLLLNHWLDTGNVMRIAKWWAEGGNVQWSRLYDGQKPVRVSLPTYPFSKEHYCIQDENITKDLIKPVPSVKDSFSIKAFEEAWEPLALTQSMIVEEENKSIICFLHDPASRNKFAEIIAMIAPSLNVIYVVKGNEFLRISDTVYSLDHNNPSTLEHLFEALVISHLDVSSIVYMWPVEENRALLDVSFVMGMMQSIARSTLQISDVIIAGAYGEDVEQASLDCLIGLERSTKQVLPNITVRVVMSENSTDLKHWSQMVVQELLHSDRTSVLYRGGIRYANVLRPIDINTDSASPLRTNGTYVVSGGTGGVGRKLVEYLVTSHDAQVILIGRSEFDISNSEWVKRLDGKSDHITYWRADISDTKVLRDLYKDYKKKHLPVNGIFHLAGVAERTLLTDKTLEDINKILHPKTMGTLAIEKVFGAESLDFICHFSSIASVLGDFGSCDYAVANRFQSSLARARQVKYIKPYPVYAINWPFLEDGGMGALAREEKDKQLLDVYLESSLQRPLDFHQMMNLLLATLRTECASPVILYVKDGKVEQVIGEYLSSDTNWIPTKKSVSLLSSDQIATSEFAIRSSVVSIVKEIASSLLNVSTEKLDTERIFADIGLDSIRIAQFARILSEKLSVTILPSIFFDYTTLSELIGFILEKHYSEIESMLKHESVPKNETKISRVSQQSKSLPLCESINQEGHNQSRDKYRMAEEPIAIIGMSGLFPEADSVERFWENLVQGRDSIKEVSKTRFDVEAYYSEKITPTTTNCKWMGSIDQVAEFDPLFFEISPREAKIMDPRQRHLLQESWKALEDAGLGEEELSHSKVGVFVGVEPGDYHLVSDGGTMTSNNDAILASRLSYFLDLKGPVLAMNTACSSGLVAVHQACASLRAEECDIAIVASANFVLSHDSFIALSQMGMLSKDGKCHTFDQSANGMVPGEAVTVLVLKRLTKAEQDGNEIYSTIIGSGINYDGRTNGIMAPSGHAQQELIESVYQKYNIDPEDIGHIVTHGTGTSLGDPVEINALIRAFSGVKSKKEFCALTATKPNIGHTFAASGLVSLISLSESIRHGVIPPSLNCQNESEYIQWENSPFYVNKSMKKWPSTSSNPRMGAVSAFGMSGTNAHLVIRQYEPKAYVIPAQVPCYLLVLSAKTKDALKGRITSMIGMFERKEINASTLNRISDMLVKKRHHFRHRCAIVVTSANDALQCWRNALRGISTERVYVDVVGRDFVADPSMIDEMKRKSRQLNEKDIQPETYIQWVSDMARLHSKGYALEWKKIDQQAIVKCNKLPPYPFSTKRYWSGEMFDMTKEVPSNRPKAVKPETNENNNKVLLVPLNDYERKASSFKGQMEKPNNISLVPLLKFESKPIPTQVKIVKKHDILEDLKSAADIGFQGMVPTLNRTGVMVEHLIPYSSDFAGYAGNCGGEVLDIGCAYGVASIAALERGATVFAMDLEQKHLDILEQRVEDYYRDRLTLKQGKLPDVDFEDGRFSAIHASRVIHFLSPDDVRLTLRKMYRWLKPGGKIFLSTDSPYFGYWQAKAPEYEQRKREGDPWPGFIENVGAYFDPSVVAGGPHLINVLDPDVFERECLLAGFIVEKHGYFEAVGIDQSAQHSHASGMEHVGIIARKPPLQEYQKYKHRNTTLSKDGVQISYEVSGRGSKAIVLVHGLGCNSSFWAEQVDYFSNHYCVVNIDLAGHGDSGSNREHWTIEAYANDVASVVNALGLTHVIMIGHSLGGPIIVEAEYLLNAHVIGLIAVDSLHNVKPTPLTDEKLEWVVDFFLESEEEVKGMFLPDADSSLIKFVELVRNSVSKYILKSSFREMIVYMQTVKSRIRKPLTLINSSSWLPTNIDAAKCHDIHVEFIENVGHYSMLEAPKILNHQIENTIAKYIKNIIKVETNGGRKQHES